MSTLLFTLDELLGFLSEHGMVPIGRSIEGRADLDHRIIRDEDLPTTSECLVVKYFLLALPLFKDEGEITSFIDRISSLTQDLAYRICFRDKTSSVEVKKQRILEMLQLVAQLVTNFVMDKKSEALFGIISYAWHERHPEPEDPSAITNALQLLGITNPQTE